MKQRNISGKRIKLVSVNRETSQAALRAALSIDFEIEMTQNTLSSIKRGHRVDADHELAAFSLILNANPAWLLYGDNQPNLNLSPLKA